MTARRIARLRAVLFVRFFKRPSAKCRLPHSDHSPVPPCQLLVWKGEAGKPSLLTRFGHASFRQPNRTWVGTAISLACTTTVSPSIVASAGANLPSAPAISNSLSGLPSRDFSPPPTWAKLSRILLPSTLMDL